MSSPSPRLPLGLAVGLAAILSLGGCGDGGDAPGGSEGGGPATTDVLAVDETGHYTVPIYFPDAGGALSAEERSFDPWTTPLDGARVLAEAVLAGPTSESLAAPMPPGTRLGVSHLSADGELYLDLLSIEHNRPPVTGSREEMLAVFSLVDSILLNLPEIEAVVLLWNGRQLPTYAGHLDTSLPLRADADLIRTRR